VTPSFPFNFLQFLSAISPPEELTPDPFCPLSAISPPEELTPDPFCPLFVIGDKYQQPVLKYLKEMGKESESPVDLVNAFEGNPDKVWTPESRARIAVWLGWCYLACGPLFCSAAVCSLMQLE